VTNITTDLYLQQTPRPNEYENSKERFRGKNAARLIYVVFSKNFSRNLSVHLVSM